MPEAAINENGDSGFGEDDVWFRLARSGNGPIDHESETATM